MIKQGKPTAWIAAALSGLGILAVTLPAQAQSPDLASVRPGGPGDYPMTVEKRTVWASDVARQKAEAARRHAEAARNVRPTVLLPVTVGRQTRAVALEPGRDGIGRAVSSELPEKATKETHRSRGYFEKRGRATFWVPYDSPRP